MEEQYQYDNGFKPKEVTLKDNYKFYNTNIFFRIFQRIICLLTSLLFLNFYRLFKGVKVKGKNNFKGVKGCLIIPMHIHPLDAFLNVSNFITKNTYTTILQSNMGFGLFSKYIRFCGSVPIPTKMNQLRSFEKQTVEALVNNKRITFFAEGYLHPYYPGVRELRRGAFKYAVQSNKPIIPCVFTYREGRKNPKLTMTYLKPIYPKEGIERDVIFNLLDDTQNVMRQYFEVENKYIKPVK